MSATIHRITVMAAASTALLAAVATAQPAVASTPAAFGPHTRPSATSSDNWAGYAAEGAAGSFTSVSSSWVEPTVTCPSSQDSYTSLWVGLDGLDNSAMEAVGTEADCISGRAEYGAWWEVLPASQSVYSGATVKAGDHLSASVTDNGDGTFTMKISDTTQGWTKSTTHKGSSGYQDSSAEVISEVDGAGGGVVPPSTALTVTFTGCLVNGSPLGGFDPEEITAPDATVSAITGGENFTVRWNGGL